MRFVTAKELKVRTRELLEEARAGARIAVTFRGKPVAILVPFEEIGEVRVRPFEESWKEIEAALSASRPRYTTVEDALSRSRRRR